MTRDVYDIGSRSNERERKKGGEQRDHDLVRQVVGQNCREENQEVLHPLVRADGLRDGRKEFLAVPPEHPPDAGRLAGRVEEPGARVDEMGNGSLPENRQVGSRVAEVLELLIDREAGGVDLDSLGHLALQVGDSLREPERKLKNAERIGTQQRHDTLEQQIGGEKRPVEVDDEGGRRRSAFIV